MSVEVALVGAAGFVGAAVAEALRRRDATVIAVESPWMRPMTLRGGQAYLDRAGDGDRAAVAEQVAGAFCVVNAAGMADSGSADAKQLVGANAILPGLLGAACAQRDIKRFVHISSAVVQGRRPLLDESMQYDVSSAYGRSKMWGERLAMDRGGPATCIYRPAGVHGIGRRVSRMTARIARSPLSSVAGPGDRPTPQALIDNVADAIAFLATTAMTPPPCVLHPWEGLTTSALLSVLGGRDPVRLPYRPAQLAVNSAFRFAGRSPRLWAQARRLEMLWFGQGQVETWLDGAGWAPPVGRAGWQALAAYCPRPDAAT